MHEIFLISFYSVILPLMYLLNPQVYTFDPCHVYATSMSVLVPPLKNSN